MNNANRNIAIALNQLLANFQIHNQNLKGFHWNVKGENFFELHEKFEELYQTNSKQLDQIAERILALEFKPYSSYSLYLEQSELSEMDDIGSGRKMIIAILESQDLLVMKMKELVVLSRNEEDFSTAYMMESFIAQKEKQQWQLNTWLKNPKVGRMSKEISYIN